LRISASVQAIEQALGLLKDLKPDFGSQALQPPLMLTFQCVKDILDLLNKLEKVQKKTFNFFLSPQNVYDKLMDKETYLDRCVTLINFSITAIRFAKEHHTPNSPKPEMKDSNGNPIKTAVTMFLENNEEAALFWHNYFGEKICVAWSDMAAAVTKSKAFGEMDQESLFVLQLQLDENKDGNISLYEFANFVGTNKLADALVQAAGSESADVIKAQAQAQNGKKPTPLSPTTPKPKAELKVNGAGKSPAKSVGSGPLPDLIWVDPNPVHNAEIVKKLEVKGHRVLQVPTSKDAITFLEGEEQQWPKMERQEKALLRSTTLRCLSNNKIYKMEEEFSTMSAAEELIRFLRKKRSPVPVLIYCGYTLPGAKKFLADGKYPLCNATDNAPEAEAYATFGKADWAVLEPKKHD